MEPAPQDLLPLLESNKIEDREKFLLLGAQVDNPSFVLIYSEQLNQETYDKVILWVDGEYGTTTAPCNIFLGPAWRLWELKSADGHHIFIGYNKYAKEPNAFWSNILSKFVGFGADACPHMYGPLVVFRWMRPLRWSELVLRRELINWLVMRYRYSSPYKFCESE
jgi:hypothetical protein